MLSRLSCIAKVLGEYPFESKYYLFGDDDALDRG